MTMTPPALGVLPDPVDLPQWLLLRDQLTAMYGVITEGLADENFLRALATLPTFTEIRAIAEQAWVLKAREHGETWDSIGRALGMPRQQVWKKYHRLAH